MPRYDRTGPIGQGPLTGRGLGPCGRGIAFRRGFGSGFGRGFGFRRMAFTRYPAYDPVVEPATLNKEEEKKILEAELKEIELEKEEIKKRLKELKI